MRPKQHCVLCAIGSLIFSVTIAGCLAKPANAPAPTPSPSPDQAKGKLKIVYYLESQFIHEYGDAFHKKYPQIELQVIPMMKNVGGKMTALDTNSILEQKPDIVYGVNLIKELTGEGKLQELTSLVKQDKFDLNPLSPAALDALKIMCNGKLVALSPDFQSEALYYNKDLFDTHKLPYPNSDISWQTFLELADKFAQKGSGRQLYGIAFDQTPYSFLSRYEWGIGVSPLSEDGRKARYDSNDDAAAVGKVLDAYRRGAIYLPPEKPAPAATRKDSLLQNPFLAGDAAMAIADPSLINQLQESASLGIPSFQWELASEPVNPVKPGQSPSVLVADAFAISNDSPNKTLAWTFLKYLVSSDMSEELTKTKPSALSIRIDAAKERNGHKLEPFYAHQPIPSNTGSAALSPKLAQQLFELDSKEWKEMLYGRETFADGLQVFQRNAQMLLDQENQPNYLEAGPITGY